MAAAPSDHPSTGSGATPAECTPGMALSDDPSRGAPGELDASVQDRLRFRAAQAVLAGLCGCTEQRAGQALHATAARHGIASARIGAQLLAALEDTPHPRAATDGEQEGLLLSLVQAALGPPDPSRRPHRGSAARPPARPQEALGVGLSTLPAETGRALLVEGELDMATGPELHERVHELRLQGPAALAAGDSVQLDLSRVTFIDTSGVRALNDVHASVALLGGQLLVTPPERPGPRRLLTVAVEAGWLAPRFAPSH